jgi:hypothetical protein
MIDFVHIPKNAGTSIKELCSPTLPDSFIRYNGHSTDPCSLLGEQLVVLREPKDRFCSAVRYSIAFMRYNPQGDLDKFHEFQTKGIVDPNSWAEILADVNHEHYKLVNSEVLNVQHNVGDLLLDDKWTYAPQHIWLNRCRSPRIALFHDLADDMRYLFSTMNRELEEIPHENAVSETGCTELSICAHQYLNNKYREDIDIFNTYNTMSREARMGRLDCP